MEEESSSLAPIPGPKQSDWRKFKHWPLISGRSRACNLTLSITRCIVSWDSPSNKYENIALCVCYTSRTHSITLPTGSELSPRFSALDSQLPFLPMASSAVRYSLMPLVMSCCTYIKGSKGTIVLSTHILQVKCIWRPLFAKSADASLPLPPDTFNSSNIVRHRTRVS